MNRTFTASVNIQGEDQKKLDVIANRIMKIALCCSGKINIIASEEDDKVCEICTIGRIEMLTVWWLGLLVL